MVRVAPGWMIGPLLCRNSPLLCRHAGCSTAVSTSCPQFGSARHCTSPRCNVHWCEARQVRQCRMCGCHTAVLTSSASGFCTVHCTSLRCTLHRKRYPVCSSPPSACCVVGSCAAHCSPPHHPRPPGSHSLRICKAPSCNERVHPECSTSQCTLHCASPHLPVPLATPLPAPLPQRCHVQRPQAVAL